MCAPSVPGRRSVPGLQPDRAAEAGATQTAVPVGVPGQVLLVVVLGVVEGRRGRDLGGDLAVAGTGENRLVGLARGLGRIGLVLRDRVDGGAVLRARVVSLSHSLGRVVALPEDPQQL